MTTERAKQKLKLPQKIEVLKQKIDKNGSGYRVILFV